MGEARAPPDYATGLAKSRAAAPATLTEKRAMKKEKEKKEEN